MEFIPGIQLNELFYREIVQPILTENYPSMAHSAALIGCGSDVLGFDTLTSMDHNWGLRLKIFLTPDDCAKHRDELLECLRQNLPHTFRGFPVGFSEPDLSDGGTQRMQTRETGPVNHLIRAGTIREFVESALGVDPFDEITLVDWLTFPEQTLLEITSGKMYHDELGLASVRAQFTYYPRDVWLYRMAAQWQRISQEEPFVGRAGDVSDDLGSRIIAARLAREVMRLGFLIEKQYAPYSKWFGMAFARLKCANRLMPILNSALVASDWREREARLADAYAIVAEMHNALGITGRIEPTITQFFDRPYHVIFAKRFTQALYTVIEDEQIKALTPIGGIDQFSDSTDLLDNPPLTQHTHVFYEMEQPK